MFRADYVYSTKCDGDKCRVVLNKVFFDIATMVEHLKKRGWSVNTMVGKCFCPECSKKENKNGKR